MNLHSISFGQVKQKQVNKMLMDLIIAQSLPFNLVNSKQFKNFCNAINPAYSIPCTKTIKTIISEEYKAGVSNLSLYLECIFLKRNNCIINSFK